MPETIPLFPLGSVLFPGMALPLHVFEERYRQLVRTLAGYDVARRRFGVVAIRQGWEVGESSVHALFPVGTLAQVRHTSEHPDGRFHLLTVGTDRFRLRAVESGSQPYMMGEVDLLPPEPATGPEEASLARVVGSLFQDYVKAIAAAQRIATVEHELPGGPGELSYLVAAAALFTLEDRQALLEAPAARDRLRHEIWLLKRETTMVHALRAVPAPLREVQIPPTGN